MVTSVTEKGDKIEKEPQSIIICDALLKVGLGYICMLHYPRCLTN